MRSFAGHSEEKMTALSDAIWTMTSVSAGLALSGSRRRTARAARVTRRHAQRDLDRAHASLRDGRESIPAWHVAWIAIPDARARQLIAAPSRRG